MKSLMTSSSLLLILLLTHQLLMRPWKQRLINDFQMHITHEGYDVLAAAPKHELNAVRDSWKKK